MTTIAYRDGVMAADSRVTVEDEAGGVRVFRCEKLYRVKSHMHRNQQVIVGLAYESFPGLVFLDWLQTGAQALADKLIEGEGDFAALVLTRGQKLYEFDKWCRGDRVLNKFYAVGSGAKAAMGAMHAGTNARVAVAIACKVDPYSAPPIVTMSL